METENKKSKLSISKNIKSNSTKEDFNQLKAEEDRLDKEIAELESQGINTDLKPQMEALHRYNEMKDVTQVVLGYLADVEQVTVTEIHKRYNLPVD